MEEQTNLEAVIEVLQRENEQLRMRIVSLNTQQNILDKINLPKIKVWLVENAPLIEGGCLLLSVFFSLKEAFSKE